MLHCRYNDLGGAGQGDPNRHDDRPILGIQGPDAKLPYPRRLRTGRKIDTNGYEAHLAPGTTPWVPYDEVRAFSSHHTLCSQDIDQCTSALDKCIVLAVMQLGVLLDVAS